MTSKKSNAFTARQHYFHSQCIHCAGALVVNVLDVTMAVNNRCV